MAAAAIAAFGSLPAKADGVKVGVLECHVKDGVGLIIMEKEKMSCTFTPVNGSPEKYAGNIHKYGLAIGVTAGTVIVWGVISANPTYQPWSLAGKYIGISADASVGLGVGANALIAGQRGRAGWPRHRHRHRRHGPRALGTAGAPFAFPVRCALSARRA
jgi:hypothetical protein